MSDQMRPSVPPPPGEAPTVPLPAAEGAPARPRRRGMMVALIVVVVLALIAAGIAIGVATGSKSASKPAPPRMVSLTVTAKSPVEVDLSWTSTGGSNVQYAILRNGQRVTDVSDRSYDDQTVTPKTAYSYSVEVIGNKGHHSRPAVASVTTPPPPPLAHARLDGRYVVKERFLSENYQNFHVGQVEREEWIVTAACASGACKVHLRLHRRGFHRTVLARRGAVYSGKGSDMLGRCGSAHVRQFLTFKIHVTRARYLGADWLVTRFFGTIHTQGAPAAGCITGLSTQSVSGRTI